MMQVLAEVVPYKVEFYLTSILEDVHYSIAYLKARVDLIILAAICKPSVICIGIYRDNGFMAIICSTSQFVTSYQSFRKESETRDGTKE